jgi:hypothetical protein
VPKPATCYVNQSCNPYGAGVFPPQPRIELNAAQIAANRALIYDDCMRDFHNGNECARLAQGYMKGK